MTTPKPPKGSIVEEEAMHVRAVSLVGRTPRVNRFVWADRIPLSAVSIIGGEGGAGKSTLCAWLVALISRGKLEGECYGDPRNVLVIAMEDDMDSVLVPRLTANGADLARVTPIVLEQGEHPLAWKFPSCIGWLEQAIQKHSPALVLIDPIVATLEGDNDKEKDVQGLLHSLNALAQKYRCAIVGVKHLTKGAGRIENALGGSGQWWNAARSVHMVGKDKELNQVVLSSVKQNSGPLPSQSLAFRFDTVELDGLGEDASGLDRPCKVTSTKVEYVGLSKVDVEQLRLTNPATEEEAEERQDCADWLADYLSHCEGSATVAEINAQGRKAGAYGKSTLRKAAVTLQLVKSKARFQGEMTWALPQSAHPLGARADVSTLDEQTGLSPDMTPLPQSAHNVLSEQSVSILDKPRDTNDKPASDSLSANEPTRTRQGEHNGGNADTPQFDNQECLPLFGDVPAHSVSRPDATLRKPPNGYPPELVDNVLRVYRETRSYRKTAERIGGLGKDKVSTIVREYGQLGS
ncbi:AAA family ATPase [Changpingibacter yushuensis]|uniref:AAA family ATPase n=1 Tax=Changpingibacter yushuensis TaxID=2758440 RepID=UPI0015F3C53F|nr:AAA family ATPase [Changpingibacter yushuensis]